MQAMFYDLSFRKVASMSLLALLLLGGVGLFTYVNFNTHFLERTWQLMQRGRSNAWYTLRYGGAWNSAVVAVASPRTQARAIPVLLYHGTPPEGNDNPPLPQSVFIEQMRALKADGWQTITLEQFRDFMKKGTPLPEKSFLLTFDDARKESFYPVDPVLKDLGFNAVMFVITGFSLPDEQQKESTFYLDKTELQYMAQTGRWELESHGNMDHALYDVPSALSLGNQLATIQDQHFLSNKFWLSDKDRVETTAEYTARITADLASSKQTLEQDFGKPVIAFAYPFNDYGQNSRNFPQSRDILAQAVASQYTFAFYQTNPVKEDPFNYPSSSAVGVKRIEPVASWSGDELVALMDNADAKTLPFTETDFKTWEWGGNWGSVEAHDTYLALAASPDTSGAVALLNGSRWWKDYRITATIGQKKGDAVSLIARYTGDSDTFLSCAFENDRLDLQAHKNGEQYTLESAEYTESAGTPAKLSMFVQGDAVSCSGYGQSVSATVNESYVHAGSTGVQIWGKGLGSEALQIDAVSVEPF